MRVLTLAGNVFKEKRTPETGNTLERWRGGSQPNHLGRGDSQEGKQSAGVMAGDPRLPPGTRASMHRGVRNNRLTEKGRESWRWEVPDMQSITDAWASPDLWRSGTEGTGGLKKKEVSDPHLGGERQLCGRMSGATGPDRARGAQHKMTWTTRGNGVERETDDDSCHAREALLHPGGKGGVHESILSREMT